MTLGEIVRRTGTERKTLRAYNVSDENLSAVREYFASQDLAVTRDRTESGRPAAFVVLESDGKFLAADPLEILREYVRGWKDGVATERPSAPPSVVAAMTDTRFESYNKRRMIHASRIVEFRGWNVGEGELHAGFQDLSKVDFQTNVYRNLARQGLDVHVYGAGDAETVAAAERLGLEVHATDSEEVLDHWWVAFDGAGSDDDKSLLLAQERGPSQFYGFWTEDPTVVDEALERVRALQPAAARP